jgi:orotate phosphoribosyltransferase
MDNLKLDFIKLMLDCNVLKFGSFITKSKRTSPYFINTGNFKDGKSIYKLSRFYANLVYNNFQDSSVLFGPAYKGISLVIATALTLYKEYSLNYAFCYNRKELKDHGEGGNLIGHQLVKGEKVVILEDVITAGTSVNETIPLLYKSCEEIKISGLIVSVDRMEKSNDNNNALEEISKTYNLKVVSIVNILEIVELLFNKEINGKVYIDEQKKEDIYEYLNKYSYIKI